MRLIFSLMMFSLLVVGLACNSAAPPTVTKVEPPKQTRQPDAHDHSQDTGVARITLEEAKKAFDAGNAVFVDTRDLSSYNQSRIKGAILVPNGQFATEWQKIPKGKKVIAYCS
jgi:3-mercaptopyruvate sulfurtransferase SseA